MSTKMNPSPRNITTIVLIIGLIFVTVGAGLTYFSYKFVQISVKTTGVVTDVSAYSRSGELRVTYTARFSFTDEQGVLQSAQVLPGQDDHNFPIGTEKSIRYDPNNPSIIKLDNFFDNWGFGFLFVLVGFGIFAYVPFAAKQQKSLTFCSVNLAIQ